MFILEMCNNSLKEELEEIILISKKLKGIKNYSFNKPADESSICKLEDAIHYSLPIEYKDFLYFSNGMTMNGFTAEFFNVEEIISLHNRKKAASFPKDYIIIADIIGDGEVLCVSNKTGQFIRYFDGETTAFNSFKDALRNLIEHIKDIEEDWLLDE